MKLFKIIANILYALVFAFLILIAASLVLTRFKTPIQYKIFSVQSGSMSPTILTGNLVVVMPQQDYQVNDVVTIRGENDPKVSVTHRIVEISEDKDLKLTSYRTKGDANNAPDPELVRKERVIGKAMFQIPYLGYVIAFAQTQTGLILLIIIPATLIIYSELLNIKNEVQKMFGKKPIMTVEPPIITQSNKDPYQDPIIKIARTNKDLPKIGRKFKTKKKT